MRPRLICVGLAAMERLVDVEQLPARGSKGRARGYREAIGGDAVAAAIAASRLGADVKLMSVIGDDATGREIVSRLRQESIGVAGLAIVPGAMSMTTAVLIDSRGQRGAAVHRDDALQSVSPVLGADALDGAQALLADGSWISGAIDALAAAHERHVPTLAIVDVAAGEDADHLFRSAEHVLVNTDGLGAYASAGESDALLRKVREQVSEKVLVVFGANGISVSAEGGAGDLWLTETEFVADGQTGVFCGAYMMAIAERRSPIEAARFACDAAVAARVAYSPAGASETD